MSSSRYDLRTDPKARLAIWRTATEPIPRSAWKFLAEAPWPYWKIFDDWSSCVMAGNKRLVHDSARTRVIAASWRLSPLRSAVEANRQLRLMKLYRPRWRPYARQSRARPDSRSRWIRQLS